MVYIQVPILDYLQIVFLGKFIQNLEMFFFGQYANYGDIV